MTHRIYPSVDAVQPPRAHPSEDGVGAQPRGMQLGDRDDAVLAIAFPCNALIHRTVEGRCDEFLGYMPTK